MRKSVAYFYDLKKKAFKDIRKALMNYYIICIKEAHTRCENALWDAELEISDSIYSNHFESSD